ncbi:energy-coupling factor transporter transmembrane component T [Janibacter terrae]|uniref:energy-coupling factor transporter transmembrane component T n=1 Tax=Janibacter terrae TaxID=103817 RepID=UPI0009EE1099|nr:energy-coupling factor transporter transmembrane component T [Janibacter terrae]HBO55208.1 cobalt ABC transporter permease [Janibacter terrae]
MTPPTARALHPGAWWLWAIGLAVAVSQTTNPLVLLLAAAAVTLVVVARRTDSPWGRAFRLYAVLGGFIIGLRLVLHVLVGLKYGEFVVLPLPTIGLPGWAAGIDLLGDVRLEGLLGALFEGLRLAVMILCIGAANALADPKRLLAALPGALQEIGTAIVVAISVAPQLAESARRVHRARLLRGDAARGLRAFRRVAMPVLEDTLERSLSLAASMDSRGYGRRGAVSPARHRTTGLLTLGGLLCTAVGSYGVLDATSPEWVGTPMLLVGVALGALGLRSGSLAVSRTTYRPSPWRTPETLTAACGVLAAVAALASVRWEPAALTMPLAPLGPPQLPWLLTLGLLVATLPAALTPPPPVHRTRAARATGTATTTTGRSHA